MGKGEILPFQAAEKTMQTAPLRSRLRKQTHTD